MHNLDNHSPKCEGERVGGREREYLNRNKGSGEVMHLLLLINHLEALGKFLIRCLLPCQEIYLSSQILLPPGAKMFQVVMTK